jgi:3-oxoacyl-[acyl-carrier protein] reductase
VAFLTGAAGGLGRCAAHTLAREGAIVVATSRRREGADEVATEIRSQGGQATGRALDVTRPEEVQTVVRESWEQFGRIDIVVTFAGLMSRRQIQEIDDQHWSHTLDVNLTGTFSVLRSIYPLMVEAKYGKIVCIGSIAGRQGGVVAGADYAAAKGAVHAMVKWLARAGAPHNVYANAIAPGPTMTPMWIGANSGVPVDDPGVAPLGRVGQPEDVAEAVLFLASSMSNYVTGAVLDVCGGAVMV